MKGWRYGIATIGVVFLIGLSSCKRSHIAKDQQLERPNIIWLVAEDQSAQFFPMYGDSTISLPNLEALANDAIVFSNAYAPVPVCAPARSAIITGMYPTSLGTHNMRAYNAYNEENEPELGISSYSPLVPKGTKMFTEYLRRAGYYCTNNAKEDYNFRTMVSAWDKSGSNAHWHEKPNDAPFFSVFNFGICHESGIWGQKDETLWVSPHKVEVPPYFPDDPIIRKDIAVNYSNLKRLDHQLGEIIGQLKTDGLYENSIIFFYSDHGGPFPRHKRALYETGTKVPMLIKYPKNANAGSRDDRFFNFIDLAPTVLSMAGILPPLHMQGKALEGVYKSNTESSYVFTTSDRFDGEVDRVRAVRGKRYKYIRNFNLEMSRVLPVKYREQMPMMKQLNVLNATEALDSLSALWYKTPREEEEFYDLKYDPYELHNLAKESTIYDTLVRYRKLLDNWMEETKDLGKYDEKDLLHDWFASGVPKASAVTLEENDNQTINLYTELHEATIVWKKSNELQWNIYTEPLPNHWNFTAKAVHIGYEDSEILVYECITCLNKKE